MRSPVIRLLFFSVSLWIAGDCTAQATGQESKSDTTRGDRMIGEYFEKQTLRLQEACLANIETREDWTSRRPAYRRQLLDMLGLQPLPPRTPLHAEVTGTTEHEDFTVENLHFQSRPGLYVTGNLYVPRDLSEPAPAILYVCGHGRVKENGVSFGNKVNYHHHGAWFARNGYVCLTIDTLQLGEIEGIHHGTYRYDMWWWLNRGYTPAGVEAWNCVRALDYLETRPEVDAERLGVTGRSGGGAYSWWIAAIDDRIQAAVPVAGITDLQNHIVDGTVEGHCDCMFMFNTYQWDYPMVAALVAPRPLLISNTDRDRIFPLEGVVRTHAKVRRIYELYDAADKLALHITAGPHQDTQELRVHAFRWFNQHLQNDDRLIEDTAVKFFEPQQLKVWDELPADERNTSISETFVAHAPEPMLPADSSDWRRLRKRWKEDLMEKTFRGWPTDPPDVDLKQVFSAESHGIRLRAFDFSSQDAIRLRLYLAHRSELRQPNLVVLNVMDEEGWERFLATMRPAFADALHEETPAAPDEEALKDLQTMFTSFDWAVAYLAPRGIGPTAWDSTPKKQVQHRRRFYLLGQSLDGMRVWDVQQAARALRKVQHLAEAPLWMESHRQMAGVTLYAALFGKDIKRVDLYQLPASHRQGPYLLNVRRTLDVPAVLAMVAENSRVVLYDADEQAWKYPVAVARQLGWNEKQLRFRTSPASSARPGDS